MKLPFIKWYTRDWLGDKQLRLCSDAAIGLWADILCLMADNDRYGFLEHNGAPLSEDQIIRLRGGYKGDVKGLLDELEQNGVFSKDERGVIYSRRMVKDAQKRAKCAEAGKLGGGNPSLRLLSSEKKEEVRTHISIKVPFKGEGGGPQVDEFSLFWKAYPKKRSMQPAMVAWAANNPTRPPIAELLAKLEKQKTWPDWIEDGGRYIPFAETYLLKGLWTDEQPDDLNTQEELSPAERRAAFEKRMSVNVSELTPELQARLFSGS